MSLFIFARFSCLRIKRIAAILLLLFSVSACSDMNSTQRHVAASTAVGAAISTVSTLALGGCVACGAAIGGAIGAGSAYAYEYLLNGADDNPDQ